MPHVTNPEDGVRVYYQVEGSGPPLVLLHGFPGSHLFWHRFGYVDALSDAYQIVLLDARGHGKSDKPHDPAAYQLHRSVQDVTAVLDDLGIERTHFFGYSAGGRVAFGAAAYAPGRFASYIIGGTHCYPYDPAVLDWLENALNQDMETLIAAQGDAVGEISDEERERSLRENDPRALLAMTQAARVGPDLSRYLRSMAQPSLLFAGEHDELNSFHDRLQEASRQMPNAEFLSIPGYGHDVSRHPELILPHIKAFLQRVSAAGR